MTFEVDIVKRLQGARHAFSLQVRFRTRTGRTVIYGPSGAGKSLTLQAIAGLLRPDGGRVAFDDAPLFDAASGVDVPARARRFGYLFQDYALFPRLTVRQNVAFGLTKGWRNPRRDIDAEVVRHWLAAFELDALADQYPVDLSGGQRQRTALARALVDSPRALLLDEPFAALDPALRGRMRDALDRLLDGIGIPIVLITHDPDDLAHFGDTTIHLDGGRVAAVTDRPPS